MSSLPRAVTRTLAAAVLAAAAPIAPVALAGAADAPITWSVRPADEHGPDGRRVIDVVLEPGQRVVEHVAVTNHSAVPVTFSISANDGYLTERGSFDMLPSDTPPIDGGAWLGVPEQATVGAGESVVVPVEVAVPETAEPGDHPAGIAASILSTGSEVAVESRVGVRVNLTVAGEAVAALDATIIDVSYEPSWNPFAPGDLVVHYEAVNTGTVAASAAAVAGATTLLGDVDEVDGGEPRELLPGGRIEQSVRVSGVWPLGPVDARLAVEPLLDEASTVSAAPAMVTLTATAWALPLAQLLLLLLLVLLVLVVRRLLRRRRARLEELLAQARAEGAAAARADGRPHVTTDTA
ncbi:hypothetical protein E1262_03625 [Jiangella aurantiaca]|uniref:DUF916 domain-containing protein n=1 Tax=Jiangella aurantiaca TaxID=2530373 RepID=A0A4R5APZ5_9ACTN|nr:hypothetical protein [Jiangella aurantiaca]TDD72402.1 hypothetical protein E1262_03625 [Jiangella aurantiaca]